MTDCNVRVVLRFRPILEFEKSVEKEKSAPPIHSLQVMNDACLQITTIGNKDPQNFAYDKIFWTDATQEEIFNFVAKATIDDVLKGYNGTIIAYGQTGSGKSFTMFGSEKNGGIIPRSLKTIFDYIQRENEGIEFTLKASFLEIYKENVRDLLEPKNSNMKVRQTPSRGVWVDGLTETPVTSKEDVLQLLTFGERLRVQGATSMNSQSSRSHSLFILTIQQKLPDGSMKESKLNLADLAGSERVSKSGAFGETLEEAKKINQSLSALGNCINSLTKTNSTHIPYRDSKLTHILKESLGGNSKTTLVITCSPHQYNIEETISTLQFGQRAKTIKNKVSVNRQRSPLALQAIIDSLTKELEGLKKYVAVLEEELKKSKGKDYDFNKLKKVAMPIPKPDLESEVRASSPKLEKMELQIELEKLREATKQQIEDLNDEISTLSKHEKDASEEYEKMKLLFEKERETVRKLQEQLSATETSYTASIHKLEYKIKEMALELEKQAATADLLKKQNEDLEEAIQLIKEEEENKEEKSLFDKETQTEQTPDSFISNENGVQIPSSENKTPSSENNSSNARSSETKTETIKPAEPKSEEKGRLRRATSTTALEESLKLKSEIESLKLKNSILEKSLEQKTERIKQQDEENEDLKVKADAFKEQLDVAFKAYLDMEQRYKQAMIWYEEAENRANKTRLVKNVRRSSSIVDFISSISPNKNAQKRASQINAETVMNGYLTKLGGVVRSWQKRWFVLKSDCLVYFRDQNDNDPKGVIALDAKSVVLDAVADTKKPYTFGIYSQDGKRTFFLCAENDDKKREWMMAIQSKINDLDVDEEEINKFV